MQHKVRKAPEKREEILRKAIKKLHKISKIVAEMLKQID